MIEIKNVFKSFGNVEVLNDISSVFKPGECSLIIGASGSGKTVLMKCLVGLHPISEGSIEYGGEDFSKMDTEEKKDIRKQIGMLFQGTALFDSMTVEENILFPLNMFSDFSIKEKMERVNFCLEKVNLIGSNKKKPSELSGGMKKRVGIARAIVLKPKYLFCDEPNSGLDPKTSIVIDELIYDITKEYDITTVINTHDMNSVIGMGDKILFLHKGKKHWEGSSEEILESTNPELKDFVFASKFLRSLKEKAEKK
ncbi:MAG: ATP-binding cassette domain-containing protein [Chitinophagaceae bacterium]|nr:MAG: ATP-binding cassette domain-containing protein [Chitinophagaceae bacterium]